MAAGDTAVLAVDAESRTFVNVLDVATATLRLKKDVKIKGQLAYARAYGRRACSTYRAPTPQRTPK